MDLRNVYRKIANLPGDIIIILKMYQIILKSVITIQGAKLCVGLHYYLLLTLEQSLFIWRNVWLVNIIFI